MTMTHQLNYSRLRELKGQLYGRMSRSWLTSQNESSCLSSNCNSIQRKNEYYRIVPELLIARNELNVTLIPQCRFDTGPEGPELEGNQANREFKATNTRRNGFLVYSICGGWNFDFIGRSGFREI